MIIIIFDIHQQILSAHCTILYKSSGLNSNHNVTFQINKNSMIINPSGETAGSWKIDFPDNLFHLNSINSVSCGGLSDCVVGQNFESVKWIATVTDEKVRLSFRVKISNLILVKSCVQNESRTLNFRDLLKRYIEIGQCYHIFCSSCSTKLTSKEVQFHCIQLHDECASELSENWFCHAHGSCKEPDNLSHSLYVGDIHFYISQSKVSDFMVFKSGREYKCIKCASVLSRNKTVGQFNHIGFYCDKIAFQKVGGDSCDFEAYKKKTALLSSLSLLKSNVSCKMYLESKAGEEISSLLLWTNSQTVYQFFSCLLEDDLTNETAFTLKEVYKVMYLIPAPDSDVAKKWKHDFNVEFFQISENMMNVLKNILQENSVYDLCKNDMKDEFSIGYLPADLYET